MKKSFVFFGNMCMCALVASLFFIWSKKIFATSVPVDSTPIFVDEPVLPPPSAIFLLGTTGVSPVGITVDSLGNVYTANIGDNTVTKITPSGFSTLFATVGSQPAEITHDVFNNIYTANSGSNTVSKITPTGVVTTFGTTGMQPVALVVDPLGTVYTANKGSNTVTKITPSGISTTLGTTGGQPSEIVISSTGVIFTLDRQTHTITRLTPDGISTVYFNFTPHAIEGLAIDTTDHLFFTDLSWGAVFKLNSFINFVGNVVGSWILVSDTGLMAPSPLILTPDNTIYTGNLSDSSVTKITKEGISITYAFVDPFPDDVALDSFGNLYVVSSDFDTVTKIIP